MPTPATPAEDFAHYAGHRALIDFDFSMLQDDAPRDFDYLRMPDTLSRLAPQMLTRFRAAHS